MYRCQLCDSIVPPLTPEHRVVLATRPSLYLLVHSEKQWTSWRFNARGEVEVRLKRKGSRRFRVDPEHRGLEILPARGTPFRISFHEGCAVLDEERFLLRPGTEVAAEARCCPACARQGPGPVEEERQHPLPEETKRAVRLRDPPRLAPARR